MFFKNILGIGIEENGFFLTTKESGHLYRQVIENNGLIGEGYAAR